ncbi:nitrate- and nitrite sensing domain-containing protein [Angustibacter sp. McL0619]|uniref:sensor histidine kinase n=1 Tax=Angustibacter sp. McL0619 TaxID=3415676 RepID=UPI003CF550E7
MVLIIGATVISAQGFTRAAQAAKVEKLANGGSALGSLILRLHQERTLAVQVSAGTATPEQIKQLKGAQAGTDKAVMETRAFVQSLSLSSLSQEAIQAVAASEGGHMQLPSVRADVVSGHGQPDQIAAKYDGMIALDAALPARIGDSLSDRRIGRSLAAYTNLANLAEYASQEAELGAVAVAAKGIDTQSAVQLSILQSAQSDQISQFRLNANSKLASAMDAALYQPIDARAAFNTERNDIMSSLGGTPTVTTQHDWIKNAGERVTSIQSLLQPLAAQTAQDARSSAADARRTAVVLLSISFIVVAFVVVLGLYLARAMTRPLRRLTVTAGELAEELPKMVERMATPGEGPGVQLPEIDVQSNDEVGRLALAFRNVNETTVRVAEEQAALRASIAEMFVNVARRNHVLLSRQLSFIDQLERTEENPDTLDNLFRLDHLATRMRRNAESLIVLAGLDSGRRLRRSMPLSDVIRTAVSEIERYDRVDLALQADPALVGHVALTTAHMIAELLENATQFSNPDTRVITATAFSSAGVRITITDLGLGMTWDEITDANQRIANPPVTDVVGSQRLGFYVVGRLARRLDATVALRPGRTQGTVVTIDLPPALFVPGSFSDLAVADNDYVELPAIEAASSNASDSSLASAPSLPAPSLPSLPSVPVAEATGLDVPVVPSPDSTGDLPRRGQAEAVPAAAADQARVEPRVPAQSAPEALVEPAGDGGLLPKRHARETSDDLDTPAELPAAAPAPRPGMFNSFRSRRAVDDSVEATAAPTGFPTLDTPLDDGSSPAFVPVIEEATPALPTREAPVAEVEALVAEVEAPAPVAESVEVPALPGPLDAGWVPESHSDWVPDHVSAEDEVESVEDESVEVESVEVESVEVVEDAPVESVEAFEPVAEVAELVEEPVAQLEPEVAQLQVVPQLEPDFEPDFAPEFEAEFEADSEVEPVAEQAFEPVAVESVPDARSTLSELAREARQAGDDAVHDAAEAPTEQVPVVPALPPIGVPAMDILPARGGRARLGRRAAKPAAAPRPVPAQPPVAQSWPAPSPIPAARQPMPAEPVVPVAAVPTTAVAEPVEPVAAPSSLFAPAPVQQEEPALAPSSLFAPEPAEPQVPVEPAFAPGVPALAAAANLRERSAMASEALSELSALSTYSPQAVEASAPAALTRRTPLATEAGQMASKPAIEEPLGARRGGRNAADVRTMLSGFRAGVERGRTSPATNGQTTTATEDADA